MEDDHLIAGDRASYLNWIIGEFGKLEKYFGKDDEGNIDYDEEKDKLLIMKHLKTSNPYIGYEGFADLIDGNSKKDFERELETLINPKKKEKVIQPSEEQRAIVKAVEAGQSVVVEAVAGSGKTTTVMFIAEAMPKSKVMQITYNKQLKFEVREKVVARKIKNLTINTYHSLAVKFYDETAHDDLKLKKIITNNLKPRFVDQINTLIIDEKQDMTPDYYHFIHKFIRDMGFQGTIVLLGDRYQGIYEFKNADSRFLTLGSAIYGKTHFTTLSLQESFRLTNKIAWFINNVMLGSNRIVSHKKAKHPVYYYKRNVFSSHLEFGRILTEYMKSGYKADDIFVLAPSPKFPPFKKLENVLVESNVPVYFSKQDDDGMDEEVIKGKVVFTTFHQAKGRERKICLVYGFDESYFEFHAKKKDRTICPSELYVAVSRASEILMVVEDEKANPLPFIKFTHNEMLTLPQIRTNVKFTGKIRADDQKTGTKGKKSSTEHNVTVKELVSYLGQENLGRLNTLVQSISKIAQKPKIETTVEIPLTMESDKGFTELVGDLNGIVIPAIFESLTTKVSSLENNLKYLHATADEETRIFVDKFIKKHKPLLKDEYSQFLCNGNLYVALKEKLRSNLEQIDKYNWLTKPIVNTCCTNLANNVKDHPLYEKPIGNCGVEQDRFFRYKSEIYGYINVRNIVDCFDDENLWEFKCVTNLTLEHILQLVVYAWIWQNCMAEKYGDRKFNLLNIRTGERINVKYESEVIDEIMEVLFENKYGEKPVISNEEFLENCSEIYEFVQNNMNDMEENPESASLFKKSGKTQKQILIKNESSDDDDNSFHNEMDNVLEEEHESSMFTSKKNKDDPNNVTKFLDKNRTSMFDATITVKKLKATENATEEKKPIKKAVPKKILPEDAEISMFSGTINVKKVKASEKPDTTSTVKSSTIKKPRAKMTIKNIQ